MKKLVLIIVTVFIGNLGFCQTWSGSGSGSVNGFIFRNGNVSIGTNTNPNNAKLFVYGRLESSADINNESIKLTNHYGDIMMRRYINGTGDNQYRHALSAMYNSSNPYPATLVVNYNGSFDNGVKVQGSKLIVTGNLGIGTEDPTEKLTVNGKILCEEVEVIADVPADYVFQKYFLGYSTLNPDYTMPTLAQVEAYIKANHHLPEVPSAQEIKEDGLQLKEMTNLLLQKIEELTLYTIEQEKRIQALEAKLNDKQ